MSKLTGHDMQTIGRAYARWIGECKYADAGMLEPAKVYGSKKKRATDADL
jgi:hypothetical protein